MLTRVPIDKVVTSDGLAVPVLVVVRSAQQVMGWKQPITLPKPPTHGPQYTQGARVLQLLTHHLYNAGPFASLVQMCSTVQYS